MRASLRPTSRPIAVVLGIAAVLASAIFVVARVAASHSPQHRAETYLAQLAAGDFAAAFDGATVPRYTLDAKPDELITHPHVTSMTATGGRARATVSYRLAGRRHTAAINLTRRGTGLFATWTVAPLTGEMTVSVNQPPTVAARADYRVGGAEASGAFAPADGDSNEYRSGHLTLAPGRYTLTARASGDVMRADPVSLLVSGTGGTGGVGLAWRLTPTATASAQQLVAELLDTHCFTSPTPQQDCLLNTLAPASGQPQPQWSSIARPSVELNRDGTITTTTPGRALSGAETVEYAVQGLFAVDEGGTAYLTNVTARAD